jgi:hypothetical protein
MPRSVGHQFDPVANIVRRLGAGKIRMICLYMGQRDCDDLIVSSGARDIAAFTSDLSDHQNPLKTIFYI